MQCVVYQTGCVMFHRISSRQKEHGHSECLIPSVGKSELYAFEWSGLQPRACLQTSAFHAEVRQVVMRQY